MRSDLTAEALGNCGLRLHSFSEMIPDSSSNLRHIQPKSDVMKQTSPENTQFPRSGIPLARLKPFPQSDRYELFYWSDMRGRWRTFDGFGRLRLTGQNARNARI